MKPQCLVEQLEAVLSVLQSNGMTHETEVQQLPLEGPALIQERAAMLELLSCSSLHPAEWPAICDLLILWKFQGVDLEPLPDTLDRD